MDTLIWACKSLYKMTVILLLVELLNVDVQSNWYAFIIILSFSTSVFSSIPYKKNENCKS